MAKDWTGKRIRNLRERLGLTQTEMAERLGYTSYVMVSNLERGVRDPSGPAQKLLDVLEQEAEESND